MILYYFDLKLGLPPSPPSLPSNSDVTIGQSDSVNSDRGRPLKPIGVDIPRNGKEDKSKPNGSIIAVVVLSSVTAFVVLIGALWLFLLKCGCCSSNSRTDKDPRGLTKPSGNPQFHSFVPSHSIPSNTNYEKQLKLYYVQENR